MIRQSEKLYENVRDISDISTIDGNPSSNPVKIRSDMDKAAPAKGIWFQESRNRWRVRVHGGGFLLTESYHKTLPEAEREHRRIKSSASALVRQKEEERRDKHVKLLNRFTLMRVPNGARTD